MDKIGTVIEMEPGTDGKFEAKRTIKPRKRKKPKVARPEPDADSRPPRAAYPKGCARSERGVTKRPVKEVSPDPLSDIQEGFQVGLKIACGIRDMVRLFR